MNVDEALDQLRIDALNVPTVNCVLVLVAELRIRLAQCETRLVALERGLVGEPLNP